MKAAKVISLTEVRRARGEEAAPGTVPPPAAPSGGEPEVFIGQGITFFLGMETYAGTIIEVAEDGSNFVFQQDWGRRRGKSRHGPAYVFQHRPESQRLGAVRCGDGFAFEWNHKSVVIGIRRQVTTPVSPKR